MKAAYRAAVDACRDRAYIPLVLKTTHRAGMRRITDPGLLETRAVSIRHALAEDYADVVACRRRST
ncbi:MAG TPA: hypothetical protein VFC56_18700 [Stellaceae bacterium]|nr:hypothetical protein [Stellaceae bacterium]